MPRILLRAGKDPFTPTPPEQVLADNILGNNSGNALFAGAMHRALSVEGVTLVADHFLTQRVGVDDGYVARINEEFDHVVLPMANAFRATFARNLGQLTRVVEGLHIPVTVVGVGAQLGVGASGDAPRPETAESARRFVRAVLARSPSIGVRGEVTRSYLRALGFGDEHVRVVGCPSLSAVTGPEVRKQLPALDRSSALAMNTTGSIPDLGSFVAHHVEAHDDVVLVPQVSQMLELLLWAQDAPSVPDPRVPIHTEHRLYAEDRIRFFVDPRTWIDWMRTRDFSFGTRIHGNVAALVAGTPAVVLTHDSRTRELAEYHEIPHHHVRGRNISTFDAAELYEQADFTAYNAGRAGRCAVFTTFLREHGLDSEAEGTERDQDYCRRLAAVPLADLVGPLGAPGINGRRAVESRIRWLRQSEDGAFRLPITATAGLPHSCAPALTVAQLQAQVARLSAELARLSPVTRAGPARRARRHVRRFHRRILSRVLPGLGSHRRGSRTTG